VLRSLPAAGRLGPAPGDSPGPAGSASRPVHRRPATAHASHLRPRSCLAPCCRLRCHRQRPRARLAVCITARAHSAAGRRDSTHVPARRASAQPSKTPPVQRVFRPCSGVSAPKRRPARPQCQGRQGLRERAQARPFSLRTLTWSMAQTCTPGAHAVSRRQIPRGAERSAPSASQVPTRIPPS
jgi:hypothetical protein